MACLVQSLTLFSFKRMFWLIQQARPGSQEAHTDNIRRMSTDVPVWLGLTDGSVMYVLLPDII